MKKEKNDCILMLYQFDRDESKREHFKILQAYFESPFFESLRTEKQLGYAVFSTYNRYSQTPAF